MIGSVWRAEFVVQADADNVLGDVVIVIDCSGREDIACAHVVHAAKINIQVFNLGAPIGAKCPFRSPARGPPGY
jgi:hypothetical protein